MILTKHAHACVVISNGSTSLAIDPGTFTPDAAEILSRVDAVLITHGHFDHLDEATVIAAAIDRPHLRVYAPTAVAEALIAGGIPDGSVTGLVGNAAFAVGDLPVRAFGSRHALIHADVPQVDSIGYLVGGAVFHPGDAYLEPGEPIDTLLLPTSGPWTKLGDAVDYVRAVAPDRTVQIHELLLSELGRRSVSNLLGADGLTGVPFVSLEPGETLEIAEHVH